MKTTAALLFATLAVTAATAAAQPAPASAPATQGAALAGEAAKLYASGDYLGAADRFDKAYALDDTLSYLFNAAQAYRLGKSCALAAARYESFLDRAPKDAQNLDKVRQYLEDERTCAKDQALAQPPDAVPVKQPVAPVPVTPPSVKPLPQPAQPPEHGHGWMRPTGIGAAAVGAVLVAFGGYEANAVRVKNNDHHNCDTAGMGMSMAVMSTAVMCTGTRAGKIDEEGKSAQTGMQVGFAVGGAALAAGGLLYYLGRDPERASLTPTAGGAVLSFGGRF